MTKILWYLFENAINIYQAYITVYFVEKFLTAKNKASRKKFLIISGLSVFCVMTILNYFTVFEGIYCILYWLPVIVPSFYFLNGNIIKKLIAPTVFQVTVFLITSLQLNLISSAFNINTSELITQQGIYRFLFLLSVQILLYISLTVIQKLFQNSEEYTFTDWLPIIAMLCASFALIFTLHRLSLRIDLKEKITINIAYTIIFVLNFLIFSLIHSLIIKNRKIHEAELIRIKEQYLEQYISNAESEYLSIKKLRHDCKEQLTTIYSLISEGNVNEALELIEQNADILLKRETYLNTNSNIVNAVINSKLTAASMLGIKVECITILDFNGIEEIDLCNLLSNMLENAITACKNIKTELDKYISINISSDENSYNFLVRNTIEHSILSTNPSLKTIKKDSSTHGLGTKIIQDIAIKYDGRCDYYEIEDMFYCQVILLKPLEGLE